MLSKAQHGNGEFEAEQSRLAGLDQIEFIEIEAKQATAADSDDGLAQADYIE